MKTRIRATAVLGLPAVVICCLLPNPAIAAASIVSPLPESSYAMRPACGTPAPGSAGCLAQELVPATAAARARLHPLGMTRATPLAAPTPAEGAYGLRPEDLRDAYFSGVAPEAPVSAPQTIALIEAYNDFDAEADLETYGQEFKSKLPKLTACSSPSAVEPGCFEQVNQEGETSNLPFPQTQTEDEKAQKFCVERGKPGETSEEPIEKWEAKEEACALVEEADGWSLETSLDIEIAHATCQNCRIVLVEAELVLRSSRSSRGNGRQVRELGGVGATEISNSWGGPEPEPEGGKARAVDSAAFNHPGIVITAAAGDDGYLNWTEAEEAKTLREPYYAGADYPASSPHVIAVGGTSLTLSEKPEAWQSEAVWNDDHDSEEPNDGAGGSGCSTSFPAPAWQRSLPNWSAVGCEDRRAVADVSADGDPYTGVAVYDSESYCEYEYEEAKKDYVVRTPWCTVGGTSLGTPLIAAMYALAGGAHGVEYPAATLYEHLETGALHTVTGANGECDGDYASGCSGSIDPQSPRFAFDCGDGVLICNAAADCEGNYYSGPVGVGTPNGIDAFKPEQQPAIVASKCAATGKSSSGSEGEGPSGSGNEPSGGSDNGGGGTTQPPTGAGGASTAGGGSSSPSGTAGSPSTTPPTAAGQPTVRLSALALTPTALLALDRPRSRISSIAFAFTLSAAARVRATLAKLVRIHGRDRWVPVPGALTFSAAKGHDRRRLASPETLASGRYRLTLAPRGGGAQTLTLQIG